MFAYSHKVCGNGYYLHGEWRTSEVDVFGCQGDDADYESGRNDEDLSETEGPFVWASKSFPPKKAV